MPPHRHRGIDIGLAAARHGGEQAAIDGRDAVEGLAAPGIHARPVD
jgi:hypothetical protein